MEMKRYLLKLEFRTGNMRTPGKDAIGKRVEFAFPAENDLKAREIALEIIEKEQEIFSVPGLKCRQKLKYIGRADLTQVLFQSYGSEVLLPVEPWLE